MSILGSLVRYLWIFDLCFLTFFCDLEGTFSMSAKLAPQSTLLEVILETFGCPGGNVKIVFSCKF